MAACSACAGDYEDPERTAPPPDAADADLETEDSLGGLQNGDGFPADERAHAGAEANDAEEEAGK
jgi:hypothetical protein